jgi:hypothetical protein
MFMHSHREIISLSTTAIFVSKNSYLSASVQTPFMKSKISTSRLHTCNAPVPVPVNN